MKMSKKQIEELLSEFKDVPDICRKQVELQRDTYLSLINKMDEYSWENLFTTGVEIKEKEGDPQVFLTKLLVPVKFTVFIPNTDTENSSSVRVVSKTLSSLLEEKLKALGFYMGPLSQKTYTSDKGEISNPFRIYMDKDTRVARIVCL
jgi:hypothetical protein